MEKDRQEERVTETRDDKDAKEGQLEASPKALGAPALLDLLAVPAALLDASAKVVRANDRFLCLVGREDVEGVLLGQLLGLEDGEAELPCPERAVFRGQSFRCTVSPLETGSEEPDLQLLELHEEQGRPWGLKEVDLLDLVEHASDLIQCVGPDGSILYVNRAWKKTLGYSDEEIAKLKFWDFISPESQEHCQALYSRLLNGEEPPRFETVFVAKDGRHVYLEGSVNGRFENGRLVNTRGIFRDITEKKRAEAEAKRLQQRLIASQRYESLGILAGGIAHDFNNILMAILGFAELMRIKASGDEDLQKYIGKIEDSAKRAAALTGQMLAFSGMSLLSKETVNLTSLVEEAKPIIEAIGSKKIRFDYRLSQDLPSIEADRNQLVQALVNLVSNAVEAMGGENGTIVIEAGAERLDHDRLAKTIGSEDAMPGRYCYLRVSDSGYGMAPDVEAKAFDPFFSTKFIGRGLGLSAVLGIVKGHQGAIELVTAPGKGTSVTIYLPQSGVTQRLLFPARRDEEGRKERPLVLVVEDEALVRELLETYLMEMGFEVLLASNGKEGMELFTTHADRLRLVILDLIMPELDGIELLKHMKWFRSSIPVLIVSGYEKHNVLDRNTEADLAGFLRKPFTRAELEKALGDILGRDEEQ